MGDAVLRRAGSVNAILNQLLRFVLDGAAVVVVLRWAWVRWQWFAATGAGGWTGWDVFCGVALGMYFAQRANQGFLRWCGWRPGRR